ncbi:MAG: AmmeMemoRadiSam system protein B, partial [Acidobacteria bacterium]|nr:AmmeMemoRadiSam system protein B [Acidobacteriota bacterium]
TDLSHYFDAATASRLDGRVTALVGAFDTEALLREFEQYPDGERGRYVACGGGPLLAVLRAARGLGAAAARVLRYANSGDVSGDYTAVVGYMAAAIGNFDRS